MSVSDKIRAALLEELREFFTDNTGVTVFIDRNGDMKNCTIDGQYDLTELVERLSGYCG